LHFPYYSRIIASLKVDDYVRIPDDVAGQSLQFGEGSFTVEAWMMPESVPTSSGTRIANNRGTGAQGEYKGWQLKIRDLDGRWRFSDSAIDDDTGNYGTYTSVNTYSYNRWYHVAMVYAADSELRFYVNGVLDGIQPIGSYGSITNDLPTAIGAAISDVGVEGTHSQFFDGVIDEVRLSDIARGEAWISAQSSNQSAPDSFYRYGTGEPLSPTAVTLSYFTGAPEIRYIQLEWETLLEIDLLGFNLYRSATLGGDRQRLNSELIPATGFGVPGSNIYDFLDTQLLTPGEQYYYWLSFVGPVGEQYHSEPAIMDAPHTIFLPIVADS
jgi:hypothetical protein